MNDDPQTTETARAIRAPWTPEQVTALNAFQQRGDMHPFTCGGDHTPGSPSLVAYTDGWRCPQPYGEACDYRQDWAHAFMADPAAASAVPVAAPPTEQAALRERIELALHSELTEYRLGRDTGLIVQRLTDAALRGTPPAADRGSVLLEAADALDADMERFFAEWPDEPRNSPYALGRKDAAALLRRLAAETPQPETQAAPEAEDPARIDRLRPEFTEHSSIESIDAQLRRARSQQRRWHLRAEWLISLRQGRMEQKERGEWPDAAPAVVQADGEA